MDYDTLLKRNNDLEEMLDEKETKMEALQRQRNSLLTPLHTQNTSSMRSKKGDSDTESAGSGSLQSISTAGDFDVARLKTELAQKSEKLLKLQMDLEMVKDELYDIKQKKKHDNNNEPSFGSGGNNSFFAQDPFGMGGGGTQHPSGDEWTDVEESESEFGEAQFGDNQFDGSQFGGDLFFKKERKEADFW